MLGPMARATSLWLVARAYVDLAWCVLAIRAVGLQRLLARASARPIRAAVSPEDVRRARRYGHCINTAARFHVLRPQCLQRSLVLHSWLRQCGLPSALRIGVCRDRDELKAHAWVELAGRVVNDRRAAVAVFTPLGPDFGVGRGPAPMTPWLAQVRSTTPT